MSIMEEVAEMYLDKDLGEYDGVYYGICYYNDKLVYYRFYNNYE